MSLILAFLVEMNLQLNEDEFFSGHLRDFRIQLLLNDKAVSRQHSLILNYFFLELVFQIIFQNWRESFKTGADEGNRCSDELEAKAKIHVESSPPIKRYS